MRTYVIRLRSLLAFGLALLTLAFIWLGLSDLDIYQKAAERVDKRTTTELVGTENPSANREEEENLPVITIEPKNSELQVKDYFFIEYRIERDRTRSEQIEILREIVNNQNSSSQMRQEAQQKLLIIAEELEKESKVESALLAKGFGEAVAVLQKDSAMVIISTDGLRQEEVAQICDVITKMTGCDLEEVVIVPKAP